MERTISNGVRTTLGMFSSREQDTATMVIRDTVTTAAVRMSLDDGVSQRALARHLNVSRYQVRRALQISIKVTDNNAAWKLLQKPRPRNKHQVPEWAQKISWDHYLGYLTESGKPRDVVRWRVGPNDYLEHKTGMQSVTTEEIFEDLLREYPNVKKHISRTFHSTPGKGCPWWRRRRFEREVCLNKQALQQRYYLEDLTSESNTGNRARWVADRVRLPRRFCLAVEARLSLSLSLDFWGAARRPTNMEARLVATHP